MYRAYSRAILEQPDYVQKRLEKDINQFPTRLAKTPIISAEDAYASRRTEGERRETKETETNFNRTLGVGSRRIAGITSDEVMNCIRNLQDMLSVDPQMYEEMMRLAYLRLRVINAFARHLYPQWPMVLEWAMLMKMNTKAFIPIRCLTENPQKSIGQPIYLASCFRGGVYLPGADGALYLSVAEKGSITAAGLFWQKVDNSLYGTAGLAIGKKVLKHDLRTFEIGI